MLGGNHLSQILKYLPDHRFNLLDQAPLPKFGLPARGVYRVPAFPFLKRIVTVALSQLLNHGFL